MFEMIGAFTEIIEKLRSINPEDIVGKVQQMAESIAAMEASQRRTESMVRALYDARPIRPNGNMNQKELSGLASSFVSRLQETDGA